MSTTSNDAPFSQCKMYWMKLNKQIQLNRMFFKAIVIGQRDWNLT